MTPAAYERQKNRVRKLFRRWREPLYLHEWHIDLVFEDGEFISPDGRVSHDAAATCHALWPYRRATITFNTQHIQHMDDDELEHTVIHEAMHILLNEMRDDSEENLDHEERVATTLAHAFQSTLGQERG